MEVKSIIPCRIEEISFAAVFLLISLRRDALLFKNYSPLYDDKYIDDFEAQKTVVENLISPKQLTGEMKKITKLVAADYKRIRNIVNRIEDYLGMSKNPLSLDISDFGQAAVRKELEAKNDEGIVKEIITLFKNTEDNKAALAPVGYTPAFSAKISKIISDLTTDSVAQTSKKDDRIVLTHENMLELNKLWKIMSKVLESGKNIANEEENGSMLKDYTFAYIEKKVRLEHKKELAAIKVVEPAQAESTK
jgi:hypothetical protein